MYVKNILTNHISVTNYIRLSLFRPIGLKKVLFSVNSNDYVLGVGYQEGDYQICISGRKKQNETLQQAVYREISEELSISPVSQPAFLFNKHRNFFYKLNIANSRYNTKISYNINPDTKDRIIACVYGKEDKILEYLKNVNLDPNNEDKITHIWADKVSNLLNYVKY